MIELVPVGYGYFGAIYDQFRGRIREAVLFLSTVRDGDVLGVSHRDELGIGDAGAIDVVWGDLSKGLAHIIAKHMISHSDFNTVEELAIVIEEVVSGGAITYSRDGTKALIRKDIGSGDFIVVVRRSLKDDAGTELPKHWIATAYNKGVRLRNKKRLALFGAGQPTASPPL